MAGCGWNAIPTTVALTTSSEDQDYPALAVSGDSAYLAYVEFTHDNRALESFAVRKQAPANFDWLARPAGGDRVKLIDVLEIRAQMERGGSCIAAPTRTSCGPRWRSTGASASG